MRGRLRWLVSGALLAALLLSTAGQSFAGNGGGPGQTTQETWKIDGTGTIRGVLALNSVADFLVGGVFQVTNTINISGVGAFLYKEYAGDRSLTIEGIQLLANGAEKRGSPGRTPEVWLEGIGRILVTEPVWSAADGGWVDTVVQDEIGVIGLRVSATEKGWPLDGSRYPGEISVSLLQLVPTGDVAPGVSDDTTTHFDAFTSAGILLDGSIDVVVTTTKGTK